MNKYVKWFLIVIMCFLLGYNIGLIGGTIAKRRMVEQNKINNMTAAGELSSAQTAVDENKD